MKFDFKKFTNFNKKTTVFLISEDLALSSLLKELDQEQSISKALAADLGFKGKVGQILRVTPTAKALDSALLIGIGKVAELNEQACLVIGGQIATEANKMKLQAIELVLEPLASEHFDLATIAAQIALGIKLNNYTFNKYFVNKKDMHTISLETVVLYLEAFGKASELFADEEHVANGVILTRDLVAEPPNVLYPETLAERCKQLEKLGVKVRVFGEKEMEKIGMHALLGVGRGSEKESKMVIMEWSGNPDKKADGPLAFVGKGVTFDTGGINLKPTSARISDMKHDMGGAGVVVGLMHALAARKSKVNALGAIGIVENMPSGTAQRPSDVVTSLSGQTIEVENTDAEGRLVLSDVLYYVEQNYKPQLMVDLATLTGAIIMALGEGGHAGLFANDDLLATQLFEAGQKTGELVWRLPMSDHYDRQINSEIADVRNTSINSSAGAGSITAAQFLKRFVTCKWAHLDIAGMAWSKRSTDYIPKGATGFGVRLLNSFVVDNYEK